MFEFYQYLGWTITCFAQIITIDERAMRLMFERVLSKILDILSPTYIELN